MIKITEDERDITCDGCLKYIGEFVIELDGATLDLCEDCKIELTNKLMNFDA